VVIPVHDENGLHRGFRPWVTWGLVGINIAVIVVLSLLSAEAALAVAYQFGVVSAFVTREVVLEGLPIPPELTLLTYMFIHASWVHLAANMIFLWVFGDNVEAATGHPRFLAFYLICGVAGALAYVISSPHSVGPLVGASGAISGIVGAYLLLRPFARVTILVLGFMTFKVRAFWVLGAWIGWQVISVWLIRPETEIAYWSHVGGIAAGLALFPLMRRRGVRLWT
jgi:membrane associated rhomboid family serine protease